MPPPTLTSLQRQLTILKIYTALSILAILTLAALGFATRNSPSPAAEPPHILRARGIIIEDDQGRDRILIGVPIPHSPHRLRTDEARVRETWAKRLGGDEYIESWKKLEHTAHGIVFLNEEGYDKLILAEKTPDPNTGKRFVDAAGFTFNDDQGFERGGLGVSRTADGGYRVVLGMDDKVGEAVHLFTLEDGTKGLQMVYEGGRILIGRAPLGSAGSGIFDTKEEFAGIRILDSEGKPLFEHNVLNKPD
jgi:hypothetical protein